MFKSGDVRKSSSFEGLSQYIEGNDVYNSLMLRKLSDPSLNKVSYIITHYEYRPDLIAREIYGSEEYCGLLMAQCRITVNGYRRGVVLRVISKSDLQNIINNN